MPGTGIKGYTGPSLYGGSYNISNGIIQSGNGAVNTSSGTSSGVSNVVNSMAKAISNVAHNVVGDSAARNMAANIAGIAGTDSSDYGDYIRQLMEMSANNTAQSQAFAREQMEFQRQSDANAMAWSAQEAEKNRQWQERLSNTAHQREVEDLIAAGLNPILSANAGAYTGSGATGQGFSSSGAMGQVDTSAPGVVGSLVSTMMNTASQASIAKLYTDAERYSADLSYSASRLNTEASILNNQNTNSATRKNVLSQIEADLERTRIQGEYGLANTALSNSGAMEREVLQQAGETGRQTIHEYGETERNKYRTDYGSGYTTMGFWNALGEKGEEVLDAGMKLYDAFLSKTNAHTNQKNFIDTWDEIAGDVQGKWKTYKKMLNRRNVG